MKTAWTFLAILLLAMTSACSKSSEPKAPEDTTIEETSSDETNDSTDDAATSEPEDVDLDWGTPATDEVDIPSFAEFEDAFRNGDAWEMSAYCADTVQVIRDPRAPGLRTTDHTPTDFVSGYERLFSQLPSDRWEAMTEKLEPSVFVAKVQNKPVRGVQVGDFVLDMNWRETQKGKRNKLERAVIFVFRMIDEEPKLVIHYADFRP